jgi:hypothetical protein
MSRQITDALSVAPASALLTLTCNRNTYDSPEDGFSALSAAFNVLCKRIRRHVKGRPFEFFLVWELTANGWPHAHCIIQSPYISQRWLSRQWRELAGSPIVDIRRIAPGPGAARYVAKYLTKALSVPPGMKRYRASRRFFGDHSLSAVLRPKNSEGWRVVRTSTFELAREFSWSGAHVELSSDGRLLVKQQCPPACLCGYHLTGAPARVA